MENNKVIITGFGPFGEHQINASWEAVKLIPSLNTNNIDLIVEEVPVLYQTVDNRIRDLWLTHNPKLVIHVGVSSIAKLLTIESQANRCGYTKRDTLGNVAKPNGEVCPSKEGSDVIQCQIDVKQICEHVNSVYNKTMLCTSDEAGRYLCEYIYYKSLNIDNARTLFVHVPPLDQPFSAKELAEQLLHIIEACLMQLSCKCN